MESAGTTPLEHLGDAGELVVEHDTIPSSDARTTTTYFDYASQPPIEIRQGCVLIPIVLAVWWYWTRRAAKRAVRLLISDGCFGVPEAEEGTDNSAFASRSSDLEQEGDENRVPVETNYDKFGTWEDVMAQESYSSNRLVKWITSSKRRKAKRRMRAVTMSVMNHRAETNNTTTTPIHNDFDSAESSLPTCEGLLAVDDAVDDALSNSGCSHWECIDDTVIEVSEPKGLAETVSHPSGLLV